MQAGGDSTVRLAVIGDVHAHLRYLELVLARIAQVGADGILLVGDIGAGDRKLRRLRHADRAYLDGVAAVFSAVRALGLPVLWVPGNHDLPDLPGEGNVDNSSAVIAGVTVAGIGGAGPDRFGFAYEWSDQEIRDRALPACEVLLCHSPPRDTALDRILSGRHVGSLALREIALAHDGAYVCGHIHESPGAVQLGRCLCLNVGGLGEPFGKPQWGYVERSSEIPGLWRAVHEDLAGGRTGRWTRTPASETA